MAQLIGVSGPQGSGKTTLLNGLEGRGEIVDDFKVSRVVQEGLGWISLSQVLESPQTMMNFQETVRDVKHARELVNLERPVDFVLTERTFADIAAYTQLWTLELVRSGKWSLRDGLEFLTPFVEDCLSRQSVYDGVLVLPVSTHIRWEEDVQRAAQEHQKMIAKELDVFFNRCPHLIGICRIEALTVEGRVRQVQDWLETM